MKYMDELDVIWNRAADHNMCECATDSNWEQRITGSIFCDKCKSVVTNEETPTLCKVNSKVKSRLPKG